MNQQSKIKDYQELKGECAPVFYKEIEKFFAKGMLVLISEALDIIDVALSIQNNEVKQMQTWVDAKQVIRVHDKHAKNWSKTNEPLMAITAVPWVLVQEIPE
jgi:hypothetical protein